LFEKRSEVVMENDWSANSSCIKLSSSLNFGELAIEIVLLFYYVQACLQVYRIPWFPRLAGNDAMVPENLRFRDKHSSSILDIGKITMSCENHKISL
jgi:hypothetical protein